MSNDPPQKPRSRLILPGQAEKPRTRLIAPAVDVRQEASQESGIPGDEAAYGEFDGPVSVTPLAPPPAPPVADADGEPPIGEAEQGEFTVIDEDTGETHTVPVKVSSMVPPPIAVAVADPDPDRLAQAEAEERARADAEAAAEMARQQAAYEAELAVYEQQQAAYEAAQQQAAYEAAQQAAYYAAQQAQMPVQPRLPHAGGYAHRPGPTYASMPVVVGGGVPGWVLIMIGLLIGFVMSVMAYRFTDFGKMIRPEEKRSVDQTSGPDLRAQRETVGMG